jgi:hypothetical protein
VPPSPCTHLWPLYRFLVKIPDSYPLDAAGPIFCAAITMYSPLAHWQVRDCSFPIETNIFCLTHVTVEELMVLDKYFGRPTEAVLRIRIPLMRILFKPLRYGFESGFSLGSEPDSNILCGSGSSLK